MKKTLLIALCLLCSGAALAQQKEYKNPFLWQKGNTTMRLSGFIRVVASSDFGGSIANNDFIVSSIPTPQPWDGKGRFGLDVSATRVGFEVVQKTKALGDIKFYIETDFRGGSEVLRLRHAYVSFLGITAGQTWSFMYDGAAQAPTIDVQGVNSRTFFRVPLIGYTYKFGKGFSVGAAVEFPKAKITTTDDVKAVTQRIPDFPLFAQYKVNGGHVKLAGVFRGLNYGDAISQTVETVFGWGVQLSGSVKVAKPLTLFAQGIYGQGIGRYINDLAAQGVDLVPDYNQAGIMNVLPMYGASVGVRGDLSKKFYLTANFATAAMDDKAEYTTQKDYLRGYYASGTFYWKAFRNMTVAAEYLYGKRENVGGETGRANRVQLMLNYDF